MASAEKVLAQAISLKPLEQAKLVDNLIAALDEPNPELDQMWAEEAESRLHAFKKGKLKAVSLTEVLSKYK